MELLPVPAVDAVVVVPNWAFMKLPWPWSDRRAVSMAANRWRRTVSFSLSCTCSAAICCFTVSICEL